MTQASRRKPARRRSEIASPEEYNAFIQQIDLQSVWLASAKIDNGIGAEPPDHTEVTVERVSSWGPGAGGFLALDTYTIVLGGSRDPAATIEVTFGLHYRSRLAMTDSLFKPFAQFNLPLNAWPYAREFVASATARMNWVPFTLPALRLGALSPTAEQNTAVATRKSRSRAMSVGAVEPENRPDLDRNAVKPTRSRRTIDLTRDVDAGKEPAERVRTRPNIDLAQDTVPDRELTKAMRGGRNIDLMGEAGPGEQAETTATMRRPRGKKID